MPSPGYACHDSRIIAETRRVPCPQTEEDRTHLGDLSTSQKFPNGLLPGFPFGRVDIARAYSAN
jgi:hypothetical protein